MLMTVPCYVTCNAEFNALQRPTSASLHRCTRRTLLRTPATVAAASLLTYLLPTSADVTAELSELAANIPGLGQADVYYPTFFLGSWMVTRTLYSVDDKVKTGISPNDRVMGIDALNILRGRLGIPQSFLVRFIKHRGHVVEDRAYNMRNEVLVDFPKKTVVTKHSPDLPNIVTISVGGQMAREVKITKRVFKNEPHGAGSFLASEYARVVDMNGDGALLGAGDAPYISAWRRVSRYQVISVRDFNGVVQPDAINRLTVDYRYSADKPDGDPQLVLKYKETLVKQKY